MSHIEPVVLETSWYTLSQIYSPVCFYVSYQPKCHKQDSELLNSVPSFLCFGGR